MRLTPCECPTSGWCPRHACWKPDTLFHQCRRNSTLFAAWEAGGGPRLTTSESVSESAEQEPCAGPGLVRRAVNFGKAVVRHAANGMQQVDQATYDARLALCTQCPSCDIARLVCLQPDCGCALSVKARWASERCPVGKWPENNGVEENIAAVVQQSE